jgi:predicted acyl esterase
MIPMRDGVKLPHQDLVVPKTKTGPLPFISVRTPYGTQNAAQNFASYLKDLADDGYIFVFQDIRGKSNLKAPL